MSFRAARSPRFNNVLSGTPPVAPNVYTQSLTGTLSFVGSTPIKQIGKSLTATLSFVGSLTRFITYILVSATLSFIGVTSRTIQRSLTGALSFVGSLVKLPNKALNASLSFTGVLSRFVTRSLSGSLSFIGNLPKSSTRAFTGSLSFSGVFSKVTRKSLSATLSFIGSISRVISRTLIATLSFIGSLTRSVSRALSGSLSFIGSLNASRLYARALTATLSFVGNLVRQVNKNLTGALSFIGNVNRFITRSLSALLSFIGALPKQFSRALSATLSFNPGASLYFDGLDNWVVATDSASLQIETSNQFSVAFWAYIDSYNNNVLPRFWEKSAQYSAIMGDPTNGKYRKVALAVTDTSAVEHEFWGGTQLNTNQLYHFVMTFDGTLSSNNAAIYINGVAETISIITPWSGGLTIHSTSGVNWFIARRHTDLLRNFNGVLDEFLVYQRVLSSAEAATIYGRGPYPTGAQAIWKFDEGTGTTTADSSGNSNTGTLSGSPLPTWSSGILTSILVKSTLRALNGTVSFIGSHIKRANKSLTGTLSFVGSLNRFITRSLSATLSFVGSLLKVPARALTGTLSFVGNLTTNLIHGATNYFQSLSGSLSFSGSLNKSTFRSLTGTLSFVGVIAKRVSRFVTGSLSFIGSFNRMTSHSFSSVLSMNYQIDPSTITGILAWYDPSNLSSISSSAGAVSQLNDLSVSGKNLTAAGTAQPTTGTKTINGLNVLDYNGSTNVLTSATFTQAQPITVFIVAKKNSATHVNSNDQAFGNNASSPTIYQRATDAWGYFAGTEQGTTPGDTNVHVFDAVFNGASSSFYIDGVLNSSANPGTGGFSSGSIRLGSAPGAASWPGQIAEVIVYSTALSASDRTRIENYLIYKWTINDLNKMTQRAIGATLSFIGNLNRKTSRALTASLSFSGNMGKQMFKALTASLSFVGAFAKQIVKGLTGSLSFVGSLSRSICHGLSAMLSFTGSLTKRLTRTLTSSTLSFSGAMGKAFPKAFTASLSFIGSLISSVIAFVAAKFNSPTHTKPKLPTDAVNQSTMISNLPNTEVSSNKTYNKTKTNPNGPTKAKRRDL